MAASAACGVSVVMVCMCVSGYVDGVLGAMLPLPSAVVMKYPPIYPPRRLRSGAVMASRCRYGVKAGVSYVPSSGEPCRGVEPLYQVMKAASEKLAKLAGKDPDAAWRESGP